MPRPRFTLRVVLAVTAIVAVLAWQLGIVWQRRVAIASGPTFIIARHHPGLTDPNLPSVNRLRELLGDVPISRIYVIPQGDWQDEMARLKKLFPEAEVSVKEPPYF